MNNIYPLQFKVLQCSALPVKEEYEVGNVLKEDTSTSFCTLSKTNVNVHLIYVGGKNNFSMSEIEVRAPMGKSSPLKNGLIWISEVAFTSPFNEYNDFTKEKYNAVPEKDNNFIYFEVSKETLSTRIKFSSPVEGKYILIKLLSAWKGSVLHVEYFGFYGIDGTIIKPLGSISISPLDIMSNIFHILDLNTFFNCALVSKRWNAWANSDAVWSRIFDKYGWKLQNLEGNLKQLYLKRSVRHVNDWVIRGPGKVSQDPNVKTLLDINITIVGLKSMDTSELFKSWIPKKSIKAKQSLVYNRKRLHFTDLSTLKTDTWTNYIISSNTVVWVIDATDRENLESKRDLIRSFTQYTSASCVFFVDKQDVPFAMDAKDFVQSYDIGGLTQKWETKKVYVQSGSTFADSPHHLGVWKLLDWISFNSAQKKK